jgi:hypothetical protein
MSPNASLCAWFAVDNPVQLIRSPVDCVGVFCGHGIGDGDVGAVVVCEVD